MHDHMHLEKRAKEERRGGGKYLGFFAKIVWEKRNYACTKNIKVKLQILNLTT